MASPDLTPYIDLRFFDKDPQDIFDAALEELTSRLPDWAPREGNVEVLLAEALALQVAESIFAINRLPGAIVMALLRMYGVEPDSGAQPLVDLQFFISDDLGHDIPAGTSVRLDLEGGFEPIVFSTVEALAVPPGSSTGTVQALGDRYTAEGNGVVSGTRVELIDSIAYVDVVETASVVASGVEPESDDDWIERGVQRFARLSETLVLPRHFEAAALEDPGVVRAKSLDNWNGSTGAPGDHGGHITVAVYGDGAFLTAPAKTTLEATLEESAAANLDVHVIDPTVQAIDVTVEVKRTTGYDDATVIASVQAALNEFLSQDTWDWGTTVFRNEIIGVISAAAGVDYVTTLTAPATDVTLTGYATLVSPGLMTVTTVA